MTLLQIGYLACIVALATLSAINYFVGRRDVLYPGFIYSFVWTVVFIAYVLSPMEIDSIGINTCLILIFGSMAFGTGALVGKSTPFRVNKTKEDPTSQKITKYILYIYCIAVFPIFYKDIMSVASGLESLVDIRTLLVDAAKNGDQVYSSVITGSIIAISISSTLISFIDHTKGSRFIYASIILTVAYCILNTGRGGLITLLFGMTAIHLIKKRKAVHFTQAVRTFGIPSIALIAAVVSYMFLTHTVVDGDIATLAVDYLFLYVVGGIAALDAVIQDGTFSAPHHTFQFFTQLSNSLFNTSFEIPQPVDDFVFVPIPTNVYTVYKFFLQDFGYAGAMLAICSIGFLHGIIYRYAKGGSKSGIYFYAITMFPMLMSFFDDTYYNFRGHIRDIIFVILTYSLLPKLIRGARRSLHFRMSKQDTYHLGA